MIIELLTKNQCFWNTVIKCSADSWRIYLPKPLLYLSLNQVNGV